MTTNDARLEAWLSRIKPNGGGPVEYRCWANGTVGILELIMAVLAGTGWAGDKLDSAVGDKGKIKQILKTHQIWLEG